MEPGIADGHSACSSPPATAVYGVFAGGDALQSTILKATVPVLGDLKFVTSSIFDIGVYLIVIGLVLDVLRSLGAELDRQEAMERTGRSAAPEGAGEAATAARAAAGPVAAPTRDRGGGRR